MTQPDPAVPFTVRFGRLPQRGLILGLSPIRVACFATATAMLLPALFSAGAEGALVTLPLWGFLVLLGSIRVSGRPAVETLPTAAHYAARSVTGQTKFRARPDRPRPAGTLALPGDAARLRLLDGQEGAAMIHDPHDQTLTVVGAVRHPAYVLLSSDEQERRVHAWGRALASLAAAGTGSRLQVLEVTLPDAGHGITGWWESHRTNPTAAPWAVEQYEQLMRTCAPAASTHRTLIAVSLDLRKARTHIRHAGRGLAGAATFLRQEMTSLEAALRAADLTLGGWLDEPALAATLLAAYDPARPPGATSDLSAAGPMAVDEHWDHLRHDSGYSQVLWIREWPRVPAQPHFLHGLIFQPGVRKTLSLTLEPVPAEIAIRDIRKAKVEYLTDAAQKNKIGMVADLSDAAEHADVLDREKALVAGHADLRYNGLVTVTAGSLEELRAASAEITRAAISAGCETRVLFGQQARAFTAAALPLARRVAR